MGRDPKADAKLAVPRTLGIWAAPFITISMVVDAGIFASLGPAAEKAGSGLPLAVGLAGLIALATGISAAKCGAVVPISGAGFIWGRTIGFDRLAFVGGVAFLVKEAVADSVNALLLFTYAQQLALSLPLHVAAAATVVAATIINYFGLGPTKKVLVVAPSCCSCCSAFTLDLFSLPQIFTG
ncbi:hypothetical protein [Geotalea sp. SG265]|uniref:hypothetical protein n=1 Tax=Geotalea sp. SG265 TaxID=2922867 RepID=UPI001FAE9503|nr:hypothetical protein [Geotalea sp. SG265]